MKAWFDELDADERISLGVSFRPPNISFDRPNEGKTLYALPNRSASRRSATR